MKKLLAVLGLVGFTALAGNPGDRLNKNGVALCEESSKANDADCFDPVSYFKSPKPVKGNSSIRAQVGSSTYVFSSEDNKKEFLAAPTKYIPQFEGWCAYGSANGKKISVNPLQYKVTDGKLYLFYKDFFNDTRSKWVKDEPNLLSKANQNWPKVRLQDEE